MTRILVTISLLALAIQMIAQKQIHRPDREGEALQAGSLLPEFAIPFPDDSLRTAEAIAFYESAIANLDGGADPGNQTRILYCIAELNRLNGRYEESLYGFLDAYRSFKIEPDNRDRSNLRSRICWTVMSMAEQNPGKGVPYEALRVFGSLDFDLLLQNTVELLGDAGNEQSLLGLLTKAFYYYQSAGDREAAYKFGRSLLEYKDIVADRQLKRKQELLEEAYEMKQKEREIQLLENQRILYEEQIRGSARQLWLLIFGVALLVIFALTLFHRIRTVRKTRDLLREMAAQLQHEKERARRNELFKEQFLANVSHEIRTPMNAIMGITNILIKNRHLPSQEKYLVAMQTSAKNLLVLINDILDLSKLEAGKVELVSTPFSPRDILDELHNRLKGRARDKGLSLRVEVEENVPEILTGDGYVLSNILSSLVMNAITFTIRGGVEVISRAGEKTRTGIMLHIEVRDTGMGIVPEKQEKILKTFVKVDESLAVDYEGSGLELAIINQLIGLQGGTIRLDSTPGVGSTFFLEIPFGINDEAIRPESVKIDPDKCEIKDISVLLVEDNEFNVMVATTELESVIGGLHLDVAANGKEALEMIEKNTYNLVLMDVQMPVMDGYEATRRIRKMNGHAGDIPIIAMTANILQQEIDKCIREGMNDYISKPFDTGELLGKMKKLLNPDL